VITKLITKGQALRTRGENLHVALDSNDLRGIMLLVRMREDECRRVEKGMPGYPEMAEYADELAALHGRLVRGTVRN
jgi:hypothetical protein